MMPRLGVEGCRPMREAKTDVATAAQRMLVVVPNWVGDVVMATPALRALREHFDRAEIVCLMRPYVAEVLGPRCFCDEVLFWSQSRSRAGGQRGFLRLARQLRRRRFDTAVLFANSFRSALLARLAGIKRRIGYDRDGRGPLLSERLVAHRRGGEFMPVSMVKYCAGLARYLGCEVDEDRLELSIRPEDASAADALLGSCGIAPQDRVVLINPGAAYGLAKCWSAERYAEVARELSTQDGVRCVVVCGPAEAPIAKRIGQLGGEDITVLADEPVRLGVLKALIKRCDLLITNDCGPRHFAKAFGRPVVTIFGPTDPRWTETAYPAERKVLIDVECGPCMLKRCPLDHRCMQLITADMVYEAATDLLGQTAGSVTSDGALA